MGKFVVEKHNGESIWRLYENEYGDIAGEEAYLTPYTEPDLERVKKTAHDDGYSEGYQAGREDLNRVLSNIEQVNKEKDEIYDEARARGYDEGRARGYQEGLFDAWEAARKISMSKIDGGFSWESMNDIFGTESPNKIYKTFTASEAIEKIRQYEQEKEEQIKVGDEVGYYGVADEHGIVNYSGVVLEIREEDYLVMEKDGKTYPLKKKYVITKTGRTFPEIAAVLAKMREG